jgi:hypothetical protein
MAYTNLGAGFSLAESKEAAVKRGEQKDALAAQKGDELRAMQAARTQERHLTAIAAVGGIALLWFFFLRK